MDGDGYRGKDTRPHTGASRLRPRHIASLSPIGRLEVIYDFKSYDNVNLYSRTE